MPSLESNDVMQQQSILNLSGNVMAGNAPDNFSRAPGTLSKSTASTATSNTNIGVGGIIQPDG